MNENFIQASLIKGFGFGLAIEKGVLQIALFFFALELDFRIVKYNLNKFVECLKEN